MARKRSGRELPTVQMPGRLTVEQLFAGDEYAQVRQSVIDKGVYRVKNNELLVQHRKLPNGDHEIMALSAVSRIPPSSDTYITSLEDYKRKQRNRATYVDLLWEVYGNHGLVNNALNKQSATVASDGGFLIRNLKKGKKQNALEIGTELLYQWTQQVNAPMFRVQQKKTAGGGVITGARGLRAMSRQAARYALVEGSWVATHNWQTVEVGTLGRFDLPITFNTISTKYLEPAQEWTDTVVESFYWVPPTNLLRELRSPTTPENRDIIKRLLPKDDLNILKRENKVLLDPALLAHVKYRGRDGVPFGEPAIASAFPALAYEQSLMQLDIVCMQNLINRLTIIMIGSSDKDSPYSTESVALARAEAMRRMIEDPGPNMTFVWAGDDVDVKDVGAHSALLDMKERMQQARLNIKDALGVPDAMLAGSTADGKAAGWAATLAMQSVTAEITEQLENLWTSMGEQILIENGFTDIEVEYRFNNSLLDPSQERMLAGQEYARGTRSIWSTIAAAKLHPQLEFIQRCKEKGMDPSTALWVDVFTPVEGVPGMGGPGAGRVPKDNVGDPSPDRAPETPTTVENK